MNLQIKLNCERCNFFYRCHHRNFYRSSCSVIKHPSGIFQKKLTNTAQSLIHDHRWPSRNWNWSPPWYKPIFSPQNNFFVQFTTMLCGKCTVSWAATSFQFGVSTLPHGYTALKIVLFMSSATRNPSSACVNTNSNLSKTKESVRKQSKKYIYVYCFSYI
jgi:hypothetical protein